MLSFAASVDALKAMHAHGKLGDFRSAPKLG